MNNIYTCFPELGFLTRYILPILYNYTRNNKIKILTNSDFSIIIKNYINSSNNNSNNSSNNNSNIELIIPDNDIYISYRRRWHGNPGTGNSDNFKIINSIGYVSNNSKLIETNTWLLNSNFINEWLKNNNINIDNIIKNCKGILYYDLIKKYPDKPWEKYVNEKNILFDLDKDLFQNWIKMDIKPQKVLKINPKLNNYIHIFPKNKNRNDLQFINLNIYINICEMIKKDFPKILICCHGNIESDMKILKDKNLIDIQVSSLEESINYYNDSKLLISPWSGMAELSFLCNMKNVIYLSNHDKTICNYNPFKNNLYKINVKNNYIEFIKNKINNLYII
tara:strand:- start:111 stop:1118 length:1008 start_codon:yes stop_codon:yes gene_type:complete